MSFGRVSCAAEYLWNRHISEFLCVPVWGEPTKAFVTVERR